MAELNMNVFGQDIKLDSTGQALVAANGELILTLGPDTGVQDIRLRLDTPLGGLFYDREFGSLVHEWKYDENDLTRRLGFCAEVTRRIRLDPRVEFGTETCTIRSWNETGIVAAASWRFIGETHRQNLVIEINNDMEMVIKDVNPGE
ncbi:MAG: hypothetical protein MI862_26730 [Desulfobacterales bacterium]|nr:hypothetical protein [Desulfobacterales bacterium]